MSLAVALLPSSDNDDDDDVEKGTRESLPISPPGLPLPPWKSRGDSVPGGLLTGRSGAPGAANRRLTFTDLRLAGSSSEKPLSLFPTTGATGGAVGAGGAETEEGGG